MIKPPSVQKDYTLIFSGDPSLSLPEDAKERENALRVARETGQWDALIKPGESPTQFHVRPLPGTAYSWLRGEVVRKKLVFDEQAELALRLALRSVDNFGAFKVRTEQVDGQAMATSEIIDALYAVDPSDVNLGRLIVAELGASIITRTLEGVPPKS